MQKFNNNTDTSHLDSSQAIFSRQKFRHLDYSQLRSDSEEDQIQERKEKPSRSQKTDNALIQNQQQNDIIQKSAENQILDDSDQSEGISYNIQKNEELEEEDQQEEQKSSIINEQENKQCQNEFNYSKSSIYNLPTTKEMLEDIRLYRKNLNENIIQGPHKSVEHLLNQHYFCLREEYTKNLRNMIQAIQKCNGEFEQLQKDEISKKFFQYDNIKIKKFDAQKDGLILNIIIPEVNLTYQKVDEESEEMLVNGNLVLIMPQQNFSKNIIYGVIQNNIQQEKILDLKGRDIKISLKLYINQEDKNIVNQINFILDASLQMNDKSQIYMFEYKDFFESYIHSQKILKKMNSHNFNNFYPQIVEGKKNVFIPNIYDHDQNLELYLNVKQIEQFQNANIGDQEWKINPYTLYPGQFQSLKDSFNRNLSLILGPPGTGKSFLASVMTYQIMQNANLSKSPIIIMSQTNNALDQFLKNMLQYTDKIIRFGGQSNDMELMDYFWSNNDQNNAQQLNQYLEQNYDILIEKYRNQQQEEQNINQDFIYWDTIQQIENMTAQFYYNPQNKQQEEFILQLQEQIIKGHLNLLNFLIVQKKYFESYINFKLYLSKEQELQKHLISLDKLIDKINEKKQIKFEKILRKADIIGLTITGGSKYRDIINYTKPKVLIVEEAALIMEGHQLASIPESVEQIIMIGDHYQLKPFLNNQKLKKKYKFDLSLFERLINNNIPYNVINQQMRMKPEIADYVRTFYKKGEYLDHHTTKNIPDALGFDKNAYFWNLDYTVEDDFQKSKINKLEIVNLLYLIRYLILQGYKPEQITILSMYKGQTILISKLIKKFEKILDKNENFNFFDIDVSKILSNFEQNQDEYKELVLYQKCLRDDQLDLQKKSQLEQEKEEKKQNERKKFYEVQKNEEVQENINDSLFNEDIKNFSDLESDSDSQIVKDLNKIKVFTIDKYQGQENDIVLISLVRSNQKNSIGFLKEKSRVNVGLSRGKSGLYVLGNFSMIKAKQNEMWDSILNLAEQKQQFSKKLPLKCQRHGKIIEIQHTIDFKQVLNGGCDQICNQMLKCNHPCQELCHPSDHENIKCQIEVEFDCLECGKKSKSLCGQQQICQNKIIQQLKCEHYANIPCSQINQVYECKQKCGKILKNCGHKCQQICHQNTECDLNICQEKVEKKFICGHVIKNVTCSSQLTQINCPEPCDGKRLNCKHKCTGTCGSCVMSTMHVNCQVKQNMVDPFCNHETIYLCGLPLEKCTKNEKKIICKCQKNKKSQNCMCNVRTHQILQPERYKCGNCNKPLQVESKLQKRYNEKLQKLQKEFGNIMDSWKNIKNEKKLKYFMKLACLQYVDSNQLYDKHLKLGKEIFDKAINFNQFMQLKNVIQNDLTEFLNKCNNPNIQNQEFTDDVIKEVLSQLSYRKKIDVQNILSQINDQYI